MTKQDATMGGGLQGPAYQASKPQAAVNFEAVWQNAYSAEFAKAANQRMIAANPNVGPVLEKLVQDYPMMSRETALGLSLSGHANYVSPAMLDLFAQEDRAAQEAAMNQGFWQKVYGGTKATSRGLMMVAEDLYNSSPVFVAPRTGINMAQGESFGSALDKSTASTAAMTAELGMLGIASNTGSGWMANDELTPADPEYFMRVKDLIASGEFEGSAEEQLLAASQQAMLEGLERYGLNPYAMAREQWQSTVMHRTIGGVDYAVPYSPGAALLLPFTTPGTRSYETFSGLVDGVSRLVFEPVDVPMDYTGELIRHSVNPLVKKGLAGYRQRAMAEVLEEGYGVEVALEPILIRHDGFTTSAKGVTSSTLDEATGTFRITVDPDITDTHYGVRMEQVVTGDDAWDLTGEFAAYVQPYADMGVTPKQVRDAIAERGGRDAEFFLTVEHELHHAEQNKKWFEIRRNEEGVAVVDYASVKPDAPDEVKQLAAQLADPEHSIGKIDELFAKGQKLEGEAAKVEADIAELSAQLDGPGQTVASRKQLRRDIGELEGKKARLADELDTARTVTDETVAKYNEAMTELNGYLESSAVKTAWNNMMDGSWIAEEAWKTYKRKQGLSRLLRPWVEPKSVNSWLKSKLGQRTLDHLARVTDIEVLRKRLKWLDERDIVKIADTTDKAVIQEIIQDAFAKPGASVRPTVGRVTDRLSKGMDGWSQTAQFVGGPVAKAMTAMGRYGSRLKTSVGNTVISATDLSGTLDTINSVLSTIEVSRQEINRIQRMAIAGHGRVTTVDAIYNEIETVSKARMLERSPGLYTADELDEIWNEWRGYQIRNQHYWTSNVGKDRKWLWSNGRFRPVTDLENPNMRPEAFMEAQFSSTTRTLPPIKSFRRLYSRQRDGYEVVKKIVKNRPNNVKGWTPHGFRPTGIMDFGDWSFGIWRDMQLMRGGWAMRILPEEQLRFGAAGFSNIFKHPIDYLITLLNNELDFTIAGDNMTLGDVLRTQEALGAGTLRDLRVPPHMVRSDTFDVASRVHDPKQFWGGLSREFIMSSSDPVVSRVAQMGRDKALAFFKTTEGKEILADIANQAAQRGSLSRIVRPEELEAYLDVVELRVAQITGGDGLWLNPETGKWVDVMDRPIPKASDRAAFPNEAALHKAMVDAAGGDESVLVGMSHRSRTDLEASLNELRGYNLDELEASGRAAVITREGNEDLRGFVGQRDLDGVTIHDEMKFDEVRAIDGHLENAFASRGVEPPESWPVARGELDDPNAKTFRNQATDEFFHWFNAVPSQVMNRQPFFQQSFGVKLAEAYQYGDSELRQAIDELRGMNDSFKVTFDVGQRKLFRDLDLNEWGKPYDTIKPRTKAEPVDASQVPDSVYDEAAAAGRYDVVPGSSEESLQAWYDSYLTKRPVKWMKADLAKKYDVPVKEVHKMIQNKPPVGKSHLVGQVDEAVRAEFVAKAEAIQFFDRNRYWIRKGEKLDEAAGHAKTLGYVESEWPSKIGSPDSKIPPFGLTQKEIHAEQIQQGLYDRVPLQNDPNSFASAILFKKMEEEGLFEGELMTMRGMYAQRYGRESTDYVGFPGVMFSSTNRHATAGAWATERMENLVLAEPGRATIAEDIVNTFGLGYVDEVENLIMEGTAEDILAFTRGMDEEKAAGFIRRIEAEQTAYRVYAGEKVDKDVLEEAALSLGWSRDKRSGGVALGPERGMMYYYGDYTDVFDIEAFPPHLRELIDKEGDLEQLYIVNKERTPALEAMDEDFVQVWNSAREKTMFKRTITSYRELHHDEAKVLKWLDSVEDDLTTLLPEPSNTELHGGEKGKPGVRDPERVDVVNAWIQTIDEEGRLDEFEAFYNHVFDAHHPDFRAEPIPGHEGIDASELLGLFDDPSMEVAGSFTTATPGSEEKLRKLVELELGREFTPEEWRDVMTFRQRLGYLPSEVVLHDTPIQPMGRFQREVLERMLNGFNVSFSNTEQAGNFALMLERNTKPVANMRQGVRHSEPIFEYSYRGYLPSTKHKMGEIVSEAEGWRAWDDFVHLEIDLRAKDKIDDAIVNMQPDGKFIRSTWEGPEMVLDFPLYMESDQFRKFVKSASESAGHLLGATKVKFEMVYKRFGELSADNDMLKAFVGDAVRDFAQIDEATVLIRAGSMGGRHQILNLIPDPDQIAEDVARYVENPMELLVFLDDAAKTLKDDMQLFEEGRVFFDMFTPNRSTFDPDPMTGWKLGSREPTEDALAGIFDFGNGPERLVENVDLPRSDETVVRHGDRPLTRHEYDRQVAEQQKMIDYYESDEGIAKYADGEDAAFREQSILDHQREIDSLNEAWESGKALSGPGAEGIPVAPAAEAVDTSKITPGEWDALSDDDWVTVYHVTSERQGRRFVGRGVDSKSKTRLEGDAIRAEQGKTGEGLYVGAYPDSISPLYGSHYSSADGTALLAIKVRKGDVLRPVESPGVRQDVFYALGSDRVGAVIVGDIPRENISFVDEALGMQPPAGIEVAPAEAAQLASKRLTEFKGKLDDDTYGILERAFAEYERTGIFPRYGDELTGRSYRLFDQMIGKAEDGVYGRTTEGAAQVAKAEAASAPVDVGLNFDGVPQLDRNAAVERVTNVTRDGTLYDRMETGHPHHYEKSSKKAVNSLNEVMMAAKRDAIEETKDLFYDLANKANVSDAMKFIAPFGDAWYEVLSRWAKIQNPTISGGQSFRNVRRAQQTINAGRQSGFLSTNEYGQEVFNWSISPGSLVNSFIPNETNVSLQGKMPISSLMFIDSSARGVFAPGVSPVVQLSAQFLEPDSMNIPLFSDAMSWLAYGSKGEYRPAGVDDALDVPQGFFPTVLSRLVSAAFDEQSRETMGNTKLRLFESIGIAGEPGFNVMVNPADARRAWDVANTAGSWLGWLRVLDSWFLPGQPQYVPEMQYEGAEDTRGMSLQEVLDQAAKLEPDTQFRIASIVRASSEYRRARELFGDAEADMYMIERYGILPSMLQSASAGMVERPVSWGGVEWVDSNPWLSNAAPLTLAWTVPPDADDTFSSRAWNNLFSEYLEIEGVENQPIRRKRSPSEILQSVQRGMGYDQLRYQNMLHDRSVAELRDQYGAGYSSDPSYRAQKNQLDRILRNNVEGIYSEFPIVRPSNQGSVVGSTQGITTRRYVDEIIDIGTPGSSRNLEFRMNVPKLASVAEQYATWFKKMDAFSRLMSDNEASSEWWMNSDSPNAQLVRIALAKEIQAYYRGLPNDSHEKEYATKLNERLMDPLLKDWEWINSAWSFEVESYPSLKFMDTLSMEGN